MIDRQSSRRGALLIGLTLIASILQAGPITSLKDTGAAGWTVSGGACPTGASNCSAGVPYAGSLAIVPSDIAIVEPIPGLGLWASAPLSGSDTSVWIVPSTRPNGTVKYPAGDIGQPMDFGANTFAFSTSFDLTGFDSTTALISGSWWADGTLDPACPIRLNGNCAGGTTSVPDSYHLASGTAFSLNNSAWFAPGINTLTFNVLNSYRETGLRVDMSSTANPSAVPEPSTFLLTALPLLFVATMKSSMRRLLLLLAPFSLLLAARQVESFETKSGRLNITPIRHASLLIEAGGQAIHVDPWSQGNYEGLPSADIILITDIHGDHLDPKAIAAVKKEATIIVAPAAVAVSVPGAVVLDNGKSKTIGNWKIEAVPMYNEKRGPSAGKFFHDKGRGNGYILTYGATRFYISGDTEGVPEMRALKNIDVAFIPMNLPFTMPPEEAAEAVKAFHPKVVYPYHYRGADLKIFEKALEGSGVEVRLRDWYY